LLVRVLLVRVLLVRVLLVRVKFDSRHKSSSAV